MSIITTQSIPLILGTNTTPRLTIASTGAATFSSSVTAGVITSSVTSGTGTLKINNSSVSKAWSFYPTTNGSQTNITLYEEGTAANVMTFRSGGNVGIGTSSPSNKLDVRNGGDFDVKFRSEAAGGTVGLLLETANTFSGTSQAYIKVIGSSGGGQSQLIFGTAGASGDASATERMRITSGGALQVKSGDAGEAMSVYTNISSTNWAFQIGGSATINGIGTGASSAATIMRMNRDSGSLRSLNAAGSINASGADYAEYMYKATNETIQKGDVCGINKNGELTNVFSDSLSFVVKSTNPSYVGNDIWGSDIDDKNELEIERAKVDRIAFSGQVPCNVLNAQVGDYIIPIELDGKISGQAVTNPTFEQYQLSVGKVWKIMEDGRAWIAVKIG
jgi:hypothetical protein